MCTHCGCVHKEEEKVAGGSVGAYAGSKAYHEKLQQVRDAERLFLIQRDVAHWVKNVCALKDKVGSLGRIIAAAGIAVRQEAGYQVSNGKNTLFVPDDEAAG